MTTKAEPGAMRKQEKHIPCHPPTQAFEAASNGQPPEALQHPSIALQQTAEG
jgi:hypothetical protein